MGKIQRRNLLLMSGALLTTIGAQAQCCDYTLLMHDSYGDGWNGGTLQVSVNGSTVGTFAAAGAGSNATFNICNGDQLELEYAAADWENENTYILFDPVGNVIFSDGPNPGVGIVFTGIGDCDATAAPGSVPCAALPIDTANCVIADNSAAIGIGLDPGCANYQGADQWYSMPVPTSGNVVVSTNNTGGLNDTGIALWTGSSCVDLTLRGCDDDTGADYFSLISGYDLPAGETLYIQVFGYGGGTGAFEICVTDPGTVTLESSELPIVLINTDGQEIPFEGKIDASMEMKYNGPGTITYVTDPSNEYSGHIGVGIRGATSAGYPQRPYNIETRTDLGENNDAPLLGMPEENDWCLLSNYNDRSLVRNPLAFELSRRMGQWAPRTSLCEVLVDSSYKGIYVFSEKIKRDAGRLDIAKLTGDENTGDDLTGGYILEQNLWEAGNSFESNYSPIDHPGFDVHFIFEYPAPDTITVPQRTYIAAFVDSLETALYGADFADPVNGYRKYLDVPSFITYFLVNELSRNNDGFKKSVFFHKDKNSNGGRLKAGPVWDFDWAWKDLYGCDIFDNTDGSGWAHHINDCPTDNYSTGWYVRMLQDSTFSNELRCSYDDYRTNILSTASLFAYIDSVGILVQNAQARHFQRWPTLGVSGPAPEVGAIAVTYSAELDTLKAWIAERLTWLDANIPGLCVNVSGNEPSLSEPLSFFPNPGNGLFHFQGSLPGTAPFSMSFYDIAGRELERLQLSSGPQRFDHELRGAGVYLFTIRRGGDLVQQGRLIVL